MINANVIFSIASPASKTRELIEMVPLGLYSPAFALEEIRKYKAEIVAKAKIDNFGSFLALLKERIHFVELEEYLDELKECSDLIEDQKDVEYIALARKKGLPLWSNDAALKKQQVVHVISTKDLLEVLF